MKVLKNTKTKATTEDTTSELTREEQVKEGIQKIEAILRDYKITFDAEITFNSKGTFPRVVVVDTTSTLNPEEN